MIKTYTLLLSLVLLSTASFCGGNAFRIVSIDPITDKVTIQNISGSPNDIGSWWLCTERSLYTQMSSLATGSTMLASNEKIVVTFVLQDDAGDAALYQTNGFSDFTQIRDFVQWGASGQGRETEADKAGLWTKGEFLEGFGPFNFVGNLTSAEHGKEFWSGGSLGTRDLISNFSSSRLYPNPISSTAILEINPILKLDEIQIVIYNLLGREVIVYNELKEHKISIERNDFLKGIYFYSLVKSGKVLDTVKFSIN